MKQALTEVWTYLDTTVRGVTGYDVEALDGSIGNVDDETNEVGSSYIVVDTGRRIFGKKVLLPAEVVQRVDGKEQKIFVNQTKKQIKHAPAYDDSMRADSEYRDLLGSYFFGGGFHD